MHNLDTEGMGVHIYSWGVISGETHSPIQVIYITWSGRKGTGVTDCDGLFGSNSSTTLHCYSVKPAAGRRATSDFSCELIDKRAKGPLEMRVDC